MLRGRGRWRRLRFPPPPPIAASSPSSSPAHPGPSPHTHTHSRTVHASGRARIQASSPSPSLAHTTTSCSRARRRRWWYDSLAASSMRRPPQLARAQARYRSKAAGIARSPIMRPENLAAVEIGDLYAHRRTLIASDPRGRLILRRWQGWHRRGVSMAAQIPDHRTGTLTPGPCSRGHGTLLACDGPPGSSPSWRVGQDPALAIFKRRGDRRALRVPSHPSLGCASGLRITLPSIALENGRWWRPLLVVPGGMGPRGLLRGR